MKWFSSFRARLILTVFPVVAGITIATLVLAEWRFMAAYRGLFAEQFDSQIAAFSAARKRRTEALSAVLEKAARQPQVLAAMAKRDAGDLNRILHPQLESLATERLQAEFPGASGARQGGGGEKGGGPAESPATDSSARGGARSPGPDSKAGGPRESLLAQPPEEGRRGMPGRLITKLPPSQTPYVAIIDPEGDFLSPMKKTGPQGRGGLPPLPMNPPPPGSAEFRRKSGRLQWLDGRKLEDVLKEQEIGYLRVEYGEEHRSEQVREVFITPIREPDSGRFLGALLFGLPLQVFAERQLYEQSKRSDFGEIMSGVWVEDALVSSTIPKDQRDEVARHVAQAMHRSGKHQRELTLSINGVRHQIFYRVLNPGSPFPLAAQVNLYPLDAMDRELAELRRDVGALGAVVLALALLVVWWMSRGLSGPIRDLVAGTHEIEQGNTTCACPCGGRMRWAVLPPPSTRWPRAWHCRRNTAACSMPWRTAPWQSSSSPKAAAWAGRCAMSPCCFATSAASPP